LPGRTGHPLLLLCIAAAPLLSADGILWRPRQSVPLAAARVPAPAPPFRFLAEDGSGHSAKVTVRDARGRTWAVKFGPEVHAETFATRLVWALGYYTDATWHVRSGRIAGARGLQRAGQHIDARGRFRDGRFEYRDPSCRLAGEWSWEQNPFAGTPELNGLKIVAMLLSNWDHKDTRDPESNNGILECGRGSAARRIYAVTDWGGSMGKWGRKFFHNKWDCEGFARQTPEFIKGVKDGEVEFGFSSGRRAGEFKESITLEHVRWLAPRLGRITDAQLRAALRASGATPHETAHFTGALRARITALQRIARRRAPQPPSGGR
jgi:hypothetical protein